MSSTSNITSEPVAVSADTQAFRTQMGHISRHSGVFFAGTMFTAAAGYLFKVYVARMLGAEALGIFTLGMTMVGLLGIFSAMGLPQSPFVSLRSTRRRAKPMLFTASWRTRLG
jgi:hypothetical protein